MTQKGIEGFDLSPQQKRVWLLQKATDNPVYRARCAVKITGQLDVEALGASLDRVVAHHEILRTVFKSLPGMTVPLQTITDSGVELHVGSAQPVSWSDGLQALPRRAFDFKQGPLLSLSLAETEQDEYLLLVDLPALCADARTLHNLICAIVAAYEIQVQNEESSLEGLQYVDYSQWHNELLVSEDSTEGRAYWQRQLDAGSGAALPSLKPRISHDSFDPKYINIPLPARVREQIEKLAAESATTPGTVLLTSWYVLLWRLSGEREVAVAVAHDGRNYDEMKDCLGLFGQYLPLCPQLASGVSFRDHVKRVALAVQESGELQDTFAWEQLDRTTERNGGPPFVACGFEEEERFGRCTAAGVSFELLVQETCLDRFDLKLSCMVGDGELTLRLHYNAAAWEEGGVERLVAQLEALLRNASSEPHTPVDRLGILGELEKRALLASWNDTQTSYPHDRCFHQLFEEQVALTPDAPAVVLGTESLSYRELHAHAFQVAGFLQERGMGPDTVVGVCMERSLDLMVALMGIFRAGGAYVALDPTYPRRRLEFMLDDTAASVVLTQNRLVDLLPETQAEVICLDCERSAIAEAPAPAVARTLPEHLAYILYTSGSTGTPKGTMVHHRGLVNYLDWCRKVYPVTEGCGALVHSSISFDLTITGLFAPLLVGASVRLVPEDLGVTGLGEVLEKEDNLSLIKLTPSHLRLLTQQIDFERIAGRTRALVIGGENLPAELLTSWRDKASQVRLFNEYGPTEAVVGCCVHEVQPDTSRAGSVPIGRPIANTELYVLDRWLEPVPVGVSGELYIGGVALARGYLNRPSATAAHFVPNPFSSDPGQRLYRTGDRACFAANGTLLFLGRHDDQIKLRGARIELGEIEAALHMHPDVEVCAAAIRPTPEGEPRLVAYVVPNAESGIDASTVASDLQSSLRRFLAELLPEFMLPSVYVIRSALPLTANGKVDRQALPLPEAVRPALRPFVAPRTEAERSLAVAWERTLGVSQVGIDDDFFELGGDSILSFQVIHKAHQAGLRLTLQQLFNFRTIRELGARIDSAPEPDEIDQGVITGAVPLTPIQHWFFEQEIPVPSHFNQALLLELLESLEPDHLRQAIQHLMNHHDALRMRFMRDKSDWHQSNAPTCSEVPLEIVRLGDLPEEERQTLVEERATAAQASLNLDTGPLLRVVFFDHGNQENDRVLLIIHHLVVDGVTWRIVLEDLYTILQQIRVGATVQLPPKTTSFKRWAEGLQAYAQEDELAYQAKYWLAEWPQIAPLPVDSKEGKNDVGSTVNISLGLSAEETQFVLLDLPRIFGTQINDVLLTALAATICSWSGDSTMLVDLEGHGREAILQGVDVSRTVGWFTSTYPLLLRVKEESLSETLRSVAAQIAEIPDRGIGYGLLRYIRQDSAVSLQLRSRPQAEVSFNYLGRFDTSLSPPGSFRLSHRYPGTTVADSTPRPHLLDVIGRVTGGELQFTWVYNESRHRRSTIAAIARRYIDTLRVLIDEAQALKDTTPVAGVKRKVDLDQRRFTEMVLIPLRPEGKLRPLFCLHPSGGMATVYTDLVRLLGDDQPVYGFQSKGWYPDEEPDTEVGAMASKYSQAMRCIQPEGPYLLAGWSSGAILAFEMAQQLTQQGERVALLASIDQPPPQPDTPVQTEATLLRAMFGKNLVHFDKPLGLLESDEHLASVMERAKEMQLVPRHAELDQARRFLHIFRVTHDAVRNYKPQPYSGSMILIRAEQQPDLPWASNPTFGWDEFALSGVEVESIPGHHDSIIAEPDVRDLAAKLHRQLARAHRL